MNDLKRNQLVVHLRNTRHEEQTCVSPIHDFRIYTPALLYQHSLTRREREGRERDLCILGSYTCEFDGLGLVELRLSLSWLHQEWDESVRWKERRGGREGRGRVMCWRVGGVD